MMLTEELDMKAKTWLRVILILGALAPVVLVAYKTNLFRDLFFLAINLIVFAWTTLPYIALGILARWLKTPLVILTSLFALVMGGCVFYNYYYDYIIRADEDAGMLLFFLTLYQLGAVFKVNSTRQP